MMTVDQVPCWVVVRGVSHAVAEARDPGTYTACRSLFWGTYPPESPEDRKKHNGRICSKCRKALEQAFPIGGAR